MGEYESLAETKQWLEQQEKDLDIKTIDNTARMKLSNNGSLPNYEDMALRMHNSWKQNNIDTDEIIKDSCK